jgi:REP element-mobilizing transposase RayT
VQTIHQRKKIRLHHYDYTRAGFYFITICTKNRESLFCTITTTNTVGVDPRSTLIKSKLGEIVEQTWLDLVNHNPSLRLHEFVVMPNHVHGIIEIDPADERVDLGSTPTDRPLSEIVRQFKSYSTRRINEYRGSTGASVWQRNYYEHIIRNEASHALIAQYIENNPSQWQEDELFVL